jgi:hypothetical protein
MPSLTLVAPFPLQMFMRSFIIFNITIAHTFGSNSFSYLGDNLKREQISFMRLSAMNISERKEFISEHGHNQLRRTPQDDFERSRALSDVAEEQQISGLIADFTELQNKQTAILKHVRWLTLCFLCFCIARSCFSQLVIYPFR